MIIDVQRSSRFVWGVHLKCVPGHCACIPVPGILDELHVQLGVGPAWIAKSLDLLASYLLQYRLGLEDLFSCLLFRNGRQPAMRHRMSADLEITAYVSDLLRGQQIPLRKFLVLRCHIKRCSEPVLFKHPRQPHVAPMTIVPTGCEYGCLHLLIVPSGRPPDAERPTPSARTYSRNPFSLRRRWPLNESVSGR